METELDPTKSVLFAQVRQASGTHGYDPEGYLRAKSHPANVASVYLGDISRTLLKVVPGLNTPIMNKKPGFDEQTWGFSCKSGDVDISVSSYKYWGFGLFTSCYANTITLEGPLSERARIIFDLVSALSHKPWQFARKSKYTSKFSNCDSNEKNWRRHISKAREDLNEMIETTLLQKGDCDDIEVARNALADDNAPAVLRALARIEADSIDVEVKDVDPDGSILQIDNDIPFVDLSINEEE